MPRSSLRLRRNASFRRRSIADAISVVGDCSLVPIVLLVVFLGAAGCNGRVEQGDAAGDGQGDADEPVVGVCTPGELEQQACATAGGAGTQTRACLASGDWGSWGDCVADGSSAACSPGQTQATTCLAGGSAGTQTRVCTSNETWGAWSACVADPIEPPTHSGQTYYVAGAGLHVGNDANPGTDEAAWRSLSFAVSQLAPGDTLVVRAGHYGPLVNNGAIVQVAETITIANSGTAQEPIVVRAEVPLAAKIYGGLVISGDYVSVYGFDIEQTESGTGVVVGGVAGAEVLGNHIHDCTRFGIEVSLSASDYRIAGNTVAYAGQVGIVVRGAGGLVDGNEISEAVAYHPKLTAADPANGDDADGMVLRGSGHVIRGNIVANYADPRDVHNYWPSDPIHNAHSDCFDVRDLSDSVVEGNHCWSNFHVSKGLIFNGSPAPRSNVTIRNNIFEYRDIGLSAYEYTDVSALYVYNNMFKSRLDDVIDSYFNLGAQAAIPGDGIHIANVADHAVFNNIAVDCDNNNNANLTGTPYDITGGSGLVDYNFGWNSDGSAYVAAADPGPHGSLGNDPLFVSYDTALHGLNDYRLQSGSPLIGAGTGSVTTPAGTTVAVESDILWTQRPQEGTYEPGPFEYLASAPPLRQASISAHVQNPALELSPTSCQPPASAVDVRIARWRGDRPGAMVIRFDDSTNGQALCGLEAFADRGLTGTWYVNPGNDNFLANRTMWDQAPALGQELANHTMHHANVSGEAAWRAEVSDAADVIWEIRHGLPLQRNASLMAFNASSSTYWSWPPVLEVAILTENSAIDRQANMGPVYHLAANPTASIPQGSLADTMYCASLSLTVDANGDCVDAGGQVVDSGVTLAIHRGVVYTAAFHGILSTDTDNCADYTSSPTSDGGNGGVQFSELESFLDRVVQAQDRIWVAGRIAVYEYSQEAQRSSIRLHQACADRIYFDLASPLSPLYDEPLTLIVTVPSDWSDCTAMQGSQPKACTVGPGGRLLIDAVPNQGRIALFRAG